MYSANRFPVLVYDRDAREVYKKGGLAAKAQDVADAGRYEDTHIIHVTDDELNMLREQWGEPSINPHTGMPEFGLFGKLFKVFKAVAPIAISFIPGVGPLASAALGAGLGATGGGGLKGALLGGALGGLGAGGAQGVGAKVGTSILGKTVAPRLSQALGSALLGGAASAALGGNPLTGALSVGLGNYIRNPMAKAPGAVPPVKASDIPTAAPSTMSAPTDVVQTGAVKPTWNGPAQTTARTLQPFERINVSDALLSGDTLGEMTKLAQAEAGGGALPIFGSGPSAGGGIAASTAKPGFWNKSFLGIKGIPNKYAIPALVAGAAALDATRAKAKDMTQEEFFSNFGSGFGNADMGAPGNFRLASLASGSGDYGKKYLGFSGGGDVDHEGPTRRRSSFAVQGPGTGRSDDIPAMLSDGEYVMDAETVALLGDGSPKAGAKRLDEFRVKIRKHKGRNLAKGKFSVNAKRPEAYLTGGRV